MNDPTHQEDAQIDKALGEDWPVKTAGTQYGNGVVSMARACRCAVKLLRNGQWTLDQFDRWLDAVITDDAAYVQEATKEIAEKMKS